MGIDQRYVAIWRGCQAIFQVSAVSRPVARSRAGAGLLAQVLTAKYADHLPLYRQTEIYAREGVPLSRSTLADWIGASAKLLRPLGDALFRYVMAGTTHGDDTTVPVLASGRGKARIGRLWAYARDEPPAGGNTPPAVAFRFSPDRKGKQPTQHLTGFAGTLHADGFTGFNNLYRTWPPAKPISQTRQTANVALISPRQWVLVGRLPLTGDESLFIALRRQIPSSP